MKGLFREFEVKKPGRPGPNGNGSQTRREILAVANDDVSDAVAALMAEHLGQKIVVLPIADYSPDTYAAKVIEEEEAAERAKVQTVLQKVTPEQAALIRSLTPEQLAALLPQPVPAPTATPEVTLVAAAA